MLKKPVAEANDLDIDDEEKGGGSGGGKKGGSKLKKSDSSSSLASTTSMSSTSTLASQMSKVDVKGEESNDFVAPKHPGNYH